MFQNLQIWERSQEHLCSSCKFKTHRRSWPYSLLFCIKYQFIKWKTTIIIHKLTLLTSIHKWKCLLVPLLQTSLPAFDTKWRPGSVVWAGTCLPEMRKSVRNMRFLKIIKYITFATGFWDLKSLVEIECFCQRILGAFWISMSLRNSETFFALNYAVNLDFKENYSPKLIP